MPRPRMFTEGVRREKTAELLQQIHPEYVPPSNDPPIRGERARGAKQAEAAFKRRTEAENKRWLTSAVRLIADVTTDQSVQDELVTALASLFASVRWEWKARRNTIPNASLPIVGGVQPTHGQMRDTLKEGLTDARKLLDWYRRLPAALLTRVTAPMSTPPHPHEPASSSVYGSTPRAAATISELRFG